MRLLSSVFKTGMIVTIMLGPGGTVECTVPSVWMVAGSNPTLAATLGPWASRSLAIAACKASACELSINAVAGLYTD